jgi:hypothetical protein
LDHATDEFRGRQTWQPLRTTAPILQPLGARFSETIQPLVSGLAAHACGASRLGHRPLKTHDPVDQKSTSLRSQLRVRM